MWFFALPHWGRRRRVGLFSRVTRTYGLACLCGQKPATKSGYSSNTSCVMFVGKRAPDVGRKNATEIGAGTPRPALIGYILRSIGLKGTCRVHPVRLHPRGPEVKTSALNVMFKANECVRKFSGVVHEKWQPSKVKKQKESFVNHGGRARFESPPALFSALDNNSNYEWLGLPPGLFDFLPVCVNMAPRTPIDAFPGSDAEHARNTNPGGITNTTPTTSPAPAAARTKSASTRR